ncbi:capsule biosynthesis GfcC family protein [Vibrio sp. B172a]|uniref:capsule biosynthesis GfcC family protein n=1 Tax=Vibrio sp. B172a TaxID=2835790 RepID=UPI002552D717|nr:capsule biosynthesis GfcC family protein [Vibrio sp. B172a]MDK9782478.1 capsule biosynthesis GfcC family protein [Vibrio sp. B172a]
MSMRLLSLLSLVGIVGITAVPALAQNQSLPPLQVELVGTGKALQFEQPSRLDNILKLAQEQNLVLQYPLAISLFDNSKQAQQESLALKNAVLNQMIQYNLVGHPFYKFIQQSQFAPRVLSAVDVDQIRLDKFDNPLLEGQFALSAPQRAEKVLYVGNVDKVYAIKNLAGIPLHEQVDSLKSSEVGELTQPPILIYPNGEVITPHHGGWLTKQYYLPPLTIVYIPFDDFGQSSMDQDIVKLLSQRKPTSSKN